MPSKSSINRVVTSPFKDFMPDEDMPRLIQRAPQPKNAVFIEKLMVKPNEQRRIPLGSFTEDKPPKGFLVEIDPDPTPIGSVYSEVTSLGSEQRYTLYIQVTNHGERAVNAEIWRL